MHTAGPWEIAQLGDGGDGFIGHQIWNRAGGEVCTIRIAVNQHHDAQYADFVARCDANARLIAAAPQLLDMTQKLAIIAESMEAGVKPSVFAWLKIRDNARAAIDAAKETG